MFETPTEDVTLTARYGGEEVRAVLAVEGEQFGVSPGEVLMTPSPSDEADGLWFQRNVEVTFEAVANTGYGFGAWTGALAGLGNPAVYALDQPVDLGVQFEMIYAVGEANYTFEAGQEQTLVLLAENGRDPVTWELVGGSGLPAGMRLRPVGEIVGTALETGPFTVTLLARDASGLEATGELALDVTEPIIGFQDLASPLIPISGSLTPAQRLYLDAKGNNNGRYDLGDLRAWILAHPDLPQTAEERAVVRALVPVVRFPSGGGR
jgi:hypothetical protein